jgi:hypothetical protein
MVAYGACGTVHRHSAGIVELTYICETSMLRQRADNAVECALFAGDGLPFVTKLPNIELLIHKSAEENRYDNT